MKGSEFMDELFIRNQLAFNDIVNKHFKLLIEQNERLISIIQDHEADMIKMAEKINALEAHINKG